MRDGDLHPQVVTMATPSFRILMIEDHAISRRVMCYVLGLRGHVCEAAESGRTALAAIDRFEPDVAILEWSLRDGSGRGLAQELRARSVARGRPLAIVAVSTSDEPDGFRGREGIDAYFTKPAIIEEIEAMCRVLLSRRR